MLTHHIYTRITTINIPIDTRSRPLACIKLIRQYFTFLLNFSSIRFIISKPFPNSYNDNTDQMSSPIRVNPTIKTARALLLDAR